MHSLSTSRCAPTETASAPIAAAASATPAPPTTQGHTGRGGRAGPTGFTMGRGRGGGGGGGSASSTTTTVFASLSAPIVTRTSNGLYPLACALTWIGPGSIMKEVFQRTRDNGLPSTSTVSPSSAAASG